LVPQRLPTRAAQPGDRFRIAAVALKSTVIHPLNWKMIFVD
jgi:hypothetical protein